MNKVFTTNWIKPRELELIKSKSKFSRDQIRILEIGSFEGRTACWFMDNYPESKIDCVDPFSSFHQKPGYPWPARNYSDTFDKNVFEYGDRVNKIISTSSSFFNNMNKREPVYDLIYIDGAHYSRYVIEDALNSFTVLKLNGIILFDNYLTGIQRCQRERPQFAINMFIECYSDYTEIIHQCRMCAIRKTKV